MERLTKAVTSIIVAAVLLVQLTGCSAKTATMGTGKKPHVLLTWSGRDVKFRALSVHGYQRIRVTWRYACVPSTKRSQIVVYFEEHTGRLNRGPKVGQEYTNGYSATGHDSGSAFGHLKRGVTWVNFYIRAFVGRGLSSQHCRWHVEITGIRPRHA